MQFMKGRTESDELKTFRSLNFRYELTEKEKRYYSNLEKGFEGEVQFDNKIQLLNNDFLVLSDLIFEHNNKEFQIDSFLLSQNKGYLFEIKNFEGDFYIKNDLFYSKYGTGTERKDPLLQLRNTESQLRQLLHQLRINYTFEGNVSFVNPEFFLYNAPMDQPIIFPNQLNRFMHKLDTIPSKLNNSHYQLAEKLIAASKPKSSYTKVPNYTYDQIKKGTACKRCWSFNVGGDGLIVVCYDCGFHEHLSSVVIRNVDEHQLLFPGRKITTREIYEWLNGVGTKKFIKTVLADNLKQIGTGNLTHFVVDK